MEENIIQAIENTWGIISYDILEMEQEMGNGTVKQDLAIEMTLDANRVHEFGGLSNTELDYYNMLSYEEKIKLAKKAIPDMEYC